MAGAEQLGREPLWCAARQADEPLSAPEHAQLAGPGYGKLGDQRQAAAPLRLRVQHVRQRESQRLFQLRLAVEDWVDQSAGYDVPAICVRRDCDSRKSGQLRIAQPQLD